MKAGFLTQPISTAAMRAPAAIAVMFTVSFVTGARPRAWIVGVPQR
jgi:hypothetical protein